MREKGLLTRPASNRRGAALALVALGMPVLLGMIALGVDLGMMMAARAESQRATDSGALAGAALFLVHPDPLDAVVPARAEAFAFTESNAIRHEAIDAVEVTVEVNPDSQMVRVTARRTIPTWFAKIFGVNEVTVATESVAHAVEAGSTSRCVKPFALPDLWWDTQDGSGTGGNEGDLQGPGEDGHKVWDLTPLTGGQGNDTGLFENWVYDAYETYGGADADPADQTGWGTSARNGLRDYNGREYVDDYGREMLVKFQDPNGGESSHWLPFVIPGYGSGVASFTENIRSCRPVTFTIGDEVEDEPGLYPNPTWKAFEDLLNEDPNAEWQETVDEDGISTGKVINSAWEGNWLNSPRVVTVPLVRPDGTISGRNEMEVVDFALVFLEWPTPRSFKSPLMGRFLFFVPGSGEGGPEVGSNVRILRLIDEDRWVPYAG
ncbi:MAG TPA: pilus assembly protein TadG-related protein [Longimicrobiales bacterium]|nr:pilus assembly protein TadG-related protein [Longimicrobiales bacterium]